jgi:HlyD family secretion protein
MNESNGDVPRSGKADAASEPDRVQEGSAVQEAVPASASEASAEAPHPASDIVLRPSQLEATQARPPEALYGGAVVVPPSRWRLRWRWVLLLILFGAGAAGGAYWWNLRQFHLPPGFAFGNGRIEADPIDIDTKFAGRVAEIKVDEGDRVTAGQVVARMDTRDMQASLNKAIAQKTQAEHSLQEARQLVDQQKAQVLLAEQEIARTTALAKKGYATQQLLDQRSQVLRTATALLNAARQRVDQAEYAVAAATHDIELYRVNIADNTLVAPKDGRIEYRISNVGEVLPAGGKVFTMLDLSYVYMDIYLPTADAGRAAIGDEARIVLDAFPKLVLPARVTYIATQAQFTPKAVETRSERDKLMFRVRARIDPALLKEHADEVRTGLPGVTYVRLDPKAEWPQQLRRELKP